MKKNHKPDTSCATRYSKRCNSATGMALNWVVALLITSAAFTTEETSSDIRLRLSRNLLDQSQQRNRLLIVERLKEIE
jgi:hypothetical protein